jgi:hypothetical protein
MRVALTSMIQNALLISDSLTYIVAADSILDFLRGCNIVIHFQVQLQCPQSTGIRPQILMRKDNVIPQPR